MKPSLLYYLVKPSLHYHVVCRWQTKLTGNTGPSVEKLGVCCLQYLVLYGFIRMLTNTVTVIIAQREVSNVEVQLDTACMTVDACMEQVFKSACMSSKDVQIDWVPAMM